MTKEELEYYINYSLKKGAEFVEIFYENSFARNYVLTDSKLDTVDSDNIRGIGIRITDGKDCYFTSTNILEKNNIEKIIEKIILKLNKKTTNKEVILNSLNTQIKEVKIPHNKFSVDNKKELLKNIDKTAREVSPYVTQVSASIIEKDKNFVIANSKGNYVKSNSILTRIVSTVFVEKNNIKEQEFYDLAGGKGYELLEDGDLIEMTKEATKVAVEKLDAKDFKGGELPVIINPGFGAVIFHEACGHGLEATSVAPHLSVFSNDMNKLIASEKVTLIDDGTKENFWGSSLIDDEGNPTQKNILIEKGILKNYLVDYLHSKKMQYKSNGCSRRQSYKYAPTSRMSNTYLAPGNDNVDDMIKSIDLGIYCERMSGGMVNPSTGDFNFAVETARLIEKGELKHYVRGITLIGNSKDILKNVEMVSNDLYLAAGYCGSKSGTIPVTIGQPTIKVSKILVGGKE